MPKIPDRHYDFSGGWNTAQNIASLGSNYLSDIQNFKFDINGALSTRNGFTKITSSAAFSARAITSGTRFYKDDGTTKFDVAFSNQTMYKLSAGAGSSIDATTFTQDSVFTFATFGNNLYYSNGTDSAGGQTMRKWTGTGTASAPTGSPANPCKYLIASSVAARGMAAGDINNPSTLYFSAGGNFEDWTTANDAGSINIYTDDGEPITGIHEINGVHVIFKPSSIHVLTGTDPQTFQRRMINDTIGCIAPYSIASTSKEIFFLSTDGFYATDGARIRKISEAINPTVAALTAPSSVRGIVYKNLYIASVSKTTSYDKIFTYDFQISRAGAWSQYSSHDARCFWKHSGEAGEVYFGTSDGHIYQFDSGSTDNGTAISAYAETAWLSLGQPERKKKYKRAYVLMEPTGSYDVDIDAYYNWVNSGGVRNTVSLAPAAATWGSFTWGSASWGASEQAKQYRIPVPGKATSTKLKISCSNPLKIYGFTIIQTPKHIK